MSQIKLLKTLKQRIKHLRGQHNQLDHAWNRGMGGGSEISVSDYRNIIKRLDEKVAAGEITQQLADLTRANIRKQANAYYDTMRSVSLGMAPTRLQRATARLSTIRRNSERNIDTAWNRGSGAQDIASAAQQSQLANQDVDRIMENFPKTQTFQQIYDEAMAKVAEELKNPTSPFERYTDQYLITNAFRHILDQYRPTDDPKNNRYNIIPAEYQSLNKDEYEYVVNALLYGSIKAQLDAEKRPTTKAKAIKPDEKRPYLEQTNQETIKNDLVADKIIERFDAFSREDPTAIFNMARKSNAIASIVQSLSEENQLYLIDNLEAQTQLLNKEILAEVQLAIGAFGTPNARLRMAEFAYNQPDKTLFDEISRTNLESILVTGKSDEELKTAITEAIRYGREILTGAHLQQAFTQVGPNKDIPISQRRHFFAEGIIPPEPHPRIVAIMNEMYEDTQKRLAEIGITEVPLYRGGDLQGGLPYEPWSTNDDVAFDFSNTGKNPDIRMAIVPAKYIFTNYVFSQLFAREFEFPILAQSFYADPKSRVKIIEERPNAGAVDSDVIEIATQKSVIEYLSNLPYNKENVDSVMKFDYRYDTRTSMEKISERTPFYEDFMNKVFEKIALQEKLNKKAGNTQISREQVIQQQIEELEKEQSSAFTLERRLAIDYLNNVIKPKPKPDTRNQINYDALPTYLKKFEIEDGLIESIIGQGNKLTPEQEKDLSSAIARAERTLKTTVNSYGKDTIIDWRNNAIEAVIWQFDNQININKKTGNQQAIDEATAIKEILQSLMR